MLSIYSGYDAMNLSQLRVFYFVAREQSFTRAAHLLNITQPAASTRVRQLERDCGSRLFDRIRQKVVLTEAGKTLFGYAQRIFQLLEDAHHALENARQLKSGFIRIGTGQTAADFISPILQRFKKTYPGVTVQVDLGNSKKILDDVLSFHLHLGLVAKPLADRGLIALACVREPMVLVVPIAHPWAKRRTVPLTALHAHPFIIREPGSGTRALVETALQRVGASPRIEMELPLNEAIKRAVEAGIGVAIMPESIIRQEVNARQLACIKLQGCRLTIEIDWVFLEDRAKSQVLQALLSIACSKPYSGHDDAHVPKNRWNGQLK
jgi:DNA-binding transcriptional LysR family regulator